MANENDNVTRDDNDKIKQSSSVEDASFVDENILKEVEENFHKKSYKKKEKNSVTPETDDGVDAKVFEHKEEADKKKKDKKEKKVSTYEKTTFAHKMKVLAVLTVLGIFTGSGLGVYYFNNFLRSNVDYSSLNPADYISNIDDTFAKLSITNADDKANWVQIVKDRGTSPSDLSPVDNMLLAEYNAKNATTYEIVGNGACATIATQTVYSMRKFDGSTYTFESISKGMLNLAICDYMPKGAKSIDVYKGSDITVSGAVWNFNQNLTLDEYKSSAGTMPNDIQPYIISDKTVSSSSDVVYDDSKGLYSFTLHLDPIKSVLLYHKQVRRTGGLEGDPEFEYVTITVTIDEDWNLVSTDIEEKYTAIKFGLPNKCVGTLYSTYKFNDAVTLPVLNK